MGDLITFPRPQRAQGAQERLWRQAVGEEFRVSRLERGRRIVDIADIAGISPQYLSELERGMKDGSSEILEAVSGALEMSVGELVQRASRRLQVEHPGTGPVCLTA